MTKTKYKVCGFRDKVKVCKFKSEDCDPDKCDMYSIPFTNKDVLKQSKKERKDIIRLTKEMKEMKKKGEHKEYPEKYKEKKLLRNDKVSGLLKLS